MVGPLSATSACKTPAMQVKWDTIWAPQSNGWSIGIVTCVSDGRAKNPNGRGVVTKGWSIVQYEGMRESDE